MTRFINLQGPHSPQDTRLLARGREVQERARSVLADAQKAPSDSVQIDKQGTNERLGTYALKGCLGKDCYPTAQIWKAQDGQLEGFVAQKPDGDFLKFDLHRTPATGLRAALATALGGAGNGLISASAWLVARGIMAQGQGHGVRAEAWVMASKPLELAGDLCHLGNQAVRDPGTKDEYYAIPGQSFDFSRNGTMEYNGPEGDPAAK